MKKKKYYLAKIDMGLNEYEYTLIKAKSELKAIKRLRIVTGKHGEIIKTIK